MRGAGAINDVGLREELRLTFKLTGCALLRSPVGRRVMRLIDRRKKMTSDEIDEVWNQHIRTREVLDVHVFARAIAAAEHEAAMRLLNHIEDVVDAANWERIDPKLWNAVTMRSNAKLTGRATDNNESNRLAATNETEGEKP